MPKKTDHQQRRALLIAALWRIAARDGLGSFTMRQLAAEAEVSVGTVQHYFASKDELLYSALRQVGEDLGARLVARIGALPEPKDPYAVVRIVLEERLPRSEQDQVHVQALIAWLGRTIAHPELAEHLVDGTRRLRELLAGQLRSGQQGGQVYPHIDPEPAADGLLAFVDGLISHLIQRLLTVEEAEAVLAEQLRHLFRAE